MYHLPTLLREIEAEARRAPFPVDTPVYDAAGRDPLVPILCAGSLAAPICSFGRDLGRDEVRHAEPQIGAAGRLVRRAFLAREGSSPRPDDPLLRDALAHVLLTNTVPYKPPGNKAYPEAVKERFRPYMERLLVFGWEGGAVITLGTEAFRWFARYSTEDVDAFWARDDRYEAWLDCRLVAMENGERREKAIRLGPLPHPSPLNRAWLPKFPGLLSGRLAGGL